MNKLSHKQPHETTSMSTPHRQPARCRGAAMSETVLSLPFILLVMVLMFFIGTAMSRLQRASVMDRYEAWRRISDAPGPSAYSQDDGATWNTTQLNQTFFGNNAASIGGGIGRYFPPEPAEVHVTVASNLWPDAGLLLQTVNEDLPSGREARFTTRHENTVPILENFSGPIQHRFVVFGHEWKFTNRITFDAGLDKWSYTSGPATSHMRSVRDQFFSDFDDRIGALADRGNDLAGIVQRFYLVNPPYRGPDLPPDWWVNASPGGP